MPIITNYKLDGIDIGTLFLTKPDLMDYYLNIDIGYKNPRLFVWGQNQTFQLGVGDTLYRSSPTQVGTATTWKHVSMSKGGTMHIIKYDNTLWNSGRPITTAGGAVQVSTPVQTSVATDWKTVDTNGQTGFILKQNGTLWTWGSNLQGLTGIGVNSGIQSAIVQIGTGTDWTENIMVTQASSTALAIKSNGTLWGWGFNFNGVFLAPNTAYSSPIQVGTSTWKKVNMEPGNSQTFAGIKTDGTLWMQGQNTYGQLGNGTTTSIFSSPIQVGIDTNWKNIRMGDGTTIGLKTDGTLWAWGDNTYGQQGVGDLIARSSPVQIGALAVWKDITNWFSGFVALRGDGTLWSWGRNDQGQLGLGDIIDRSSPTQIGSLTTWKQIFCQAAINDGLEDF